MMLKSIYFEMSYIILSAQLHDGWYAVEDIWMA